MLFDTEEHPATLTGLGHVQKCLRVEKSHHICFLAAHMRRIRTAHTATCTSYGSKLFPGNYGCESTMLSTEHSIESTQECPADSTVT